MKLNREVKFKKDSSVTFRADKKPANNRFYAWKLLSFKICDQSYMNKITLKNK